MNLLVTGGCGFIGSNFINNYLSNETITLVNLDAMYYCANELNIDIEIRKSDKYNLVKGNICDSDLIDYVLNKYNISHVIHFAAQSHVQNSFNDSKQYTKDNVVGTHTLLECCRIYGKIEKFIHVSTDEVYGESMLGTNETQKTEQSILCPSNPYAATKAAAELIAQSYYHSFKMPIVITRGNNVYGRNQYPEKLIPRFIHLLNNDKKVTIQGDGSNVRAFLHVEDAVNAFKCILEKGEIGEIYNIGCDDGMEYSVLDIAKMLIKLIKNTDNYEEWIEYIEDRPFNDKRYYISNEKVKKLGWNINVNFEDGLKNLVGYIKDEDDILDRFKKLEKENITKDENKRQKSDTFEISILTMQKNEDLLLEAWIVYNSKLMPYKNICILDNGSTDINVINILKKYENKGVNVIYSYNKKEDFEDKGRILKDIAQKFYSKCNFVFFLDVDEFISLENQNCNKDDILNYIKSLPIDKQYVYRNTRMLYNVCYYENHYFPTNNSKVFFRGGTIKELDLGFHEGKCFENYVCMDTSMEIIHFHNKPYKKNLESAKEKMELRVDVNDKEKIKNYSNKNKGYHLKEILLHTEETYIERMKEVYEASIYNKNFKEKLKEYNVVIPF